MRLSILAGLAAIFFVIVPIAVFARAKKQKAAAPKTEPIAIGVFDPSSSSPILRQTLEEKHKQFLRLIYYGTTEDNMADNFKQLTDLLELPQDWLQPKQADWEFAFIRSAVFHIGNPWSIYKGADKNYDKYFRFLTLVQSGDWAGYYVVDNTILYRHNRTETTRIDFIKFHRQEGGDWKIFGRVFEGYVSESENVADLFANMSYDHRFLLPNQRGYEALPDLTKNFFAMLMYNLSMRNNFMANLLPCDRVSKHTLEALHRTYMGNAIVSRFGLFTVIFFCYLFALLLIPIGLSSLAMKLGEPMIWLTLCFGLLFYSGLLFLLQKLVYA